MNCWHCNKELIWGGDHDTEDNEDYDIVSNLSCPNCHSAVDPPLIWGGDHDTEDNEDYDIVSNLSCPNCHTAVDVWHPSEKLIKEYKDYEEKQNDK